MSIAQAIKVEDSAMLSLPASVYNVREYIRGGEPFGTLYVDKKGHWHLTVTHESSPTVNKGIIVLE